MGVWMVGQSNAAPVIIIKRKKIIQGGGHHGGAWKVAYADFVTAMMAFFMLMWLLNATTEKQRKGIADYFNPTVAINRISGGGDGAFYGDSIFSDKVLARNGTGGADTANGAGEAPQGATKSADQAAVAAEVKAMVSVEKALTAYGGESMTMQRLLRHVITKVTDEGMVIELFDTANSPLFEDDSAVPTGEMRKLAALLSEVLTLAANDVAVEGYMRAYPITMKDNPTWDLSAARAQTMRELLESTGLQGQRIARIVGHADRKPVTADPSALRNNRVEVILLRKDR